MKNKTTKKKPKHGVKFIGGGFYLWQIWGNGVMLLESPQAYLTLDDCANNLRSICEVLYPHTIENQVVTEAVERFKKEKSK